MSSTPGILDNSDATAITIGSDESVTLTSTVTTTGLTINTDADSSLSIADGGTSRLLLVMNFTWELITLTRLGY